MRNDPRLVTFKDLLQDHIYGLIGLARPSLQERIQPNYFMSKEWVYQDFALEFLSLDGQAYVLYMV
jgi:hypothetical protein